MPKNKGGRPKGKVSNLEKVAKDLMKSEDDNLRYKGAMLQLKINEKTPPKETTAVDPFVMGFILCIQKLSDELNLSGERILARLGEQTEAIEQLVRGEMS